MYKSDGVPLMKLKVLGFYSVSLRRLVAYADHTRKKDSKFGQTLTTQQHGQAVSSALVLNISLFIDVSFLLPFLPYVR